jgi:hypothetical protein
MKTDITISAEQRVALERLVADRNTSAKVVWRARIVLASADSESVKAVARATGARGSSRSCMYQRTRSWSRSLLSRKKHRVSVGL